MPKILVVDDDRDILFVMRLLLTNNGFQVDVISKGEETINRAIEFLPDLIILDVWLAGIDGRDIVQETEIAGRYKKYPGDHVLSKQ